MQTPGRCMSAFRLRSWRAYAGLEGPCKPACTYAAHLLGSEALPYEGRLADPMYKRYRCPAVVDESLLRRICLMHGMAARSAKPVRPAQPVDTLCGRTELSYIHCFMPASNVAEPNPKT